MAVIMSKKIVVPNIAGPVAVTITGTTLYVNKTYGSVTIAGTEYTSEASGIEVLAGDVISFYIKGNSLGNGSLTIDGTKVASTSGSSTSTTYDWTVPDGITAIAVALSYKSNNYGAYSVITVTTS